jgi:hypothetical protein
MPMFLKNEHNRLAFRFGRANALRSTSDLVDQLQAQLAIERACVAELKAEVDALLKELLEARAELTKRNMVDKLAAMPIS